MQLQYSLECYFTESRSGQIKFRKILAVLFSNVNEPFWIDFKSLDLTKIYHKVRVCPSSHLTLLFLNILYKSGTDVIAIKFVPSLNQKS